MTAMRIRSETIFLNAFCTELKDHVNFCCSLQFAHHIGIPIYLVYLFQMCRLADSIFLALFYMVFFCFVLFLLDTLGTLKQIQTLKRVLMCTF